MSVHQDDGLRVVAKHVCRDETGKRQDTTREVDQKTAAALRQLRAGQLVVRFDSGFVDASSVQQKISPKKKNAQIKVFLP